MANFFSADYWKALYFKAMGGQATAVDPNAMSGSFAGSASFIGTLANGGVEEVQGRSQGGVDPYYYKKRKKKKPEPVSKQFGDTWQPPKVEPVIPPLPDPREILARQDEALANTWQQLASALEAHERQQAEALAQALQEQEDEEEVLMLLLAA